VVNLKLKNGLRKYCSLAHNRCGSLVMKLPGFFLICTMKNRGYIKPYSCIESTRTHFKGSKTNTRTIKRINNLKRLNLLRLFKFKYKFLKYLFSDCICSRNTFSCRTETGGANEHEKLRFVPSMNMNINRGSVLASL
jgi:hypothetical protein